MKALILCVPSARHRVGGATKQGIIDTKSSFADWLNNQIVRDQLKFDIKVCLIKNGYPPQYSPEVFRKVMEQVENFEENS